MTVHPSLDVVTHGDTRNNVPNARMLVPTDHVADAILGRIIRELETATTSEDTFLDLVRANAAEAAEMARDGVLDPAETFEAIARAAMIAQAGPVAVVRGIIAGAFADLYVPEPVAAIASPVHGFMQRARAAMYAAQNGTRELTLQNLSIECGRLVAARCMEWPDAVDFLTGLATASGLMDIGAVENVIGMALRGRAAITGSGAASSVGHTPRLVTPEDGQIPLVAELASSEPYPIHALGPVLRLGAEAIARKIQAPVAMAAQSVLAVAALAAQAHADVQLPYGQARPLSLDLITVASSGDRKTSTDREAAWPLCVYEEELHSAYRDELESYRSSAATWEAEKKKIEGDKKATRDTRKVLFEELGSAPVAPLVPFLTAPEMTIEGLFKAMPRAHPSLGLFSAEGGQFVGGHGMSTDNRLRTAAALSSLWDGGTIKRIRAGDGVSILKGRRLSVHIMIQPDVATAFLTDPLLRDQGLLSRLLVAAPCSIAGTRCFQEIVASDEEAIREYGGQILRLLRKPWPLVPGTDNELAPPTLPMSNDARNCWRAFHDETEGQIGVGGRLAPVRDFAGKAAEHAARVAGVLTIVKNAEAGEISLREMIDAVELIRWYLCESLRLCAAAMTDSGTRSAVRLLDWLRVTYPTHVFSLRNIVQFGPAELRSKGPAETAVRKLVEHGFVQERSARPLRWALVRAVDSSP